MVFAPYRGFISNYNSIEYDAKKTLQSFRPLSGFLFSNERAVLVDVYMPSIVSVPYQGFYFLMSADIATYGMGKFVVSVPFVLVKLFCNTLFDKYLSVASLHWC